MITLVGPTDNTTTFTYESVGNLAAIADPLGNTTTRTYDLVSRLTAQMDPRGRTTRFAYDLLNRLTQIVDALNGVTAFAYDGNGNLLAVTDARGNTTTHSYESMDRLATRTDPLGRQEFYQYDLGGNLIQFTDRKGQVSSFSYDPLNRRIRSDFADATFTEFIYDAAGRLLQASDSQTGTIVEEYDVLDRLIRETTPQGSIQYAYDPLGRRSQMTVDGQAPVAYTYDANSRLRTITQAPLNPVVIKYDALGRRMLLTLPNSVSTEYQYDAASRLTALVYRNPSGVLGNLTYQYDRKGNRTSVGGSLARTLLPNSVTAASYDGANRQVAFGPKTMVYDANGNLVTLSEGATTTNFTWDARNRLVAVSGATTGSFAYDAKGRRAVREIDGKFREYLYDTVDVVQENINGVEVNYLRTLAVDEPLCRIEPEGTSYYLVDALSSTLALTDAVGAIDTTYSYGPFGRTISAGALSTNPFQFTGRERDVAGLYFYRARTYSPILARFLSEDTVEPFGYRVGTYHYTLNNPVTFNDPEGRDPGGRGDCVYYDRLCNAGKCGGRQDQYACDAAQCCRDFGEGLQDRCVRKCLISNDADCRGLPGGIRGRCRFLFHVLCYTECFKLPIGIPASCNKISFGG